MSIHFSNPGRDIKHVSSYSRLVVSLCMKDSGVSDLWITSSLRTPGDQSAVMMNALINRFNHDYKKWSNTMYAEKGARVEAIARRYISDATSGVRDGFNPNRPMPSQRSAEQTMKEEIDRLEREHGVGCVSAHQKCSAAYNVFDIGLKSVSPPAVISQFVNCLATSGFISKLGIPKGMAKPKASIPIFFETNSCIHLEIAQPDQMLVA